MTGNLENLGMNSMITPVIVLAGMGILFFMLNIIISRIKIVSKKA
jgi:hypothetical protein